MSFFVALVSLSGKQTQCISLLVLGLSQRQVCEEIGVTARTVQRWKQDSEFSEAMEISLTQAKQETAQQSAKLTTGIVHSVWQRRDQLREKELSLLSVLEDKLMNCLEGDTPDYRAIDRLLKLSERRSKLLGLDVRNYPILDAIELLLKEQVASHEHAEIVVTNILNMEEQLRNITTASIDIAN